MTLIKKLHYQAHTTWLPGGTDTRRYDGYSRHFRIAIPGKPEINGSADPFFRGDPGRHNPEDLLIAAVSGCHMLVFLALCAQRGICITAYQDKAHGTLDYRPGQGGWFTSITCTAQVTLADSGDTQAVAALFDQAAKGCFIAASVNFPITHHLSLTAD